MQISNSNNSKIQAHDLECIREVQEVEKPLQFVSILPIYSLRKKHLSPFQLYVKRYLRYVGL